MLTFSGKWMCRHSIVHGIEFSYSWSGCLKTPLRLIWPNSNSVQNCWVFWQYNFTVLRKDWRQLLLRKTRWAYLNTRLHLFGDVRGFCEQIDTQIWKWGAGNNWKSVNWVYKFFFGTHILKMKKIKEYYAKNSSKIDQG